MKADRKLMEKAIKVAEDSSRKGDYAIGAVVARGSTVIAVGQTLLKRSHDPTVHAEIVAMRKACKKLGTRYLDGCVLYTTHEPCPMCAAAAVWAKMEGIVFGATINDSLKKRNKKFSWRQIMVPCSYVLKKGEPKLSLVKGFMRKECLALDSK